jgi:hypothetical protein
MLVKNKTRGYEILTRSQNKLKAPFRIGLGLFLWLNPKRINIVLILLIPFTGLSSLAVAKV